MTHDRRPPLASMSAAAARMLSLPPMDPLRLEPLVASGGGNNRVFRVDALGQSYLLKAYFRHPGDTRDRLKAELSFCQFAWSHGLRCVPQPVASDAQEGLGLYDFVDGRRSTPPDVAAERVDAAADFVAELNRHRAEPLARELPAASEACFSLLEHVSCVEQRLARLGQMQAQSDLDRRAVEFIQDELNPAWQRVKQEARDLARAGGLVWDVAMRDR